jgi:hypothetical protein
MSPAERRTRLACLLSEIDQQIREAESLGADPLLDAGRK